MTGLISVAWVVLGLAVLPAGLFLVNLLVYRPPRWDGSRLDTPAVSVLLPARNEERAIEGAIRAALANGPSLARAGVELEVMVLDDGSTDRTGDIVAELAAEDSRVRLETGSGLPAGWCGKMHGCDVLGRRATHDYLVYVDSDVRLEPDGLVRLLAEAERQDLALISGVPRQVTNTWAEKLVVPLIHFVLLGFLPMPAARLSNSPAFAAGCGQLFGVRRPDYLAMGGHSTIRATLHDGIELPRAFRAEGLRAGLVDATTVCSCHMYGDAKEVWEGFAKNATEGLASVAMIVPATLLLLGGQVLPWLLGALWATGVIRPTGMESALLALAMVAALIPRAAAALAFRQSWLGVLGHPVGVAMLVGIQWHARLRAMRGVAAVWKGRSYPA